MKFYILLVFILVPTYCFSSDIRYVATSEKGMVFYDYGNALKKDNIVDFWLYTYSERSIVKELPVAEKNEHIIKAVKDKINKRYIPLILKMDHIDNYEISVVVKLLLSEEVTNYRLTEKISSYRVLLDCEKKTHNYIFGSLTSDDGNVSSVELNEIIHINPDTVYGLLSDHLCSLK